MEQVGLINLLNNAENKGVLAKSLNTKIQKFLDYSTKSMLKLFMIITVLIGALFVLAGLTTLAGEYWSDYPKHIKGIISLIPALIAIYLYFIAVSKHKSSVVWIEGTSMLLMLMIGLSMGLFVDTYDISSEENNFFKVWLLLSLPLFYIARASGIAILYLGISSIFLINIGWNLFIPEINTNPDYLFFWIFFIGFLPHFLLGLNLRSNKQNFRTIFLGWLIVHITPLALVMGIQGGHLFWGLIIIMVYYFFGKKYFGGNLSFFARPFQTFSFLTLAYSLLIYSNDLSQSLINKVDNLSIIHNWSIEHHVFYFLGLISLIAIGIWAYKARLSRPEWNRYIVYLPALLIFSLGLFYLEDFHLFDITWISTIVLNIFILGYGINAMIQGNRYKNVLYMFYGLFITYGILAMRLQDMTWAFWIKGLFFIGVGFLFFLIYYLVKDDEE